MTHSDPAEHAQPGRRSRSRAPAIMPRSSSRSAAALRQRPTTSDQDGHWPAGVVVVLRGQQRRGRSPWSRHRPPATVIRGSQRVGVRRPSRWPGRRRCRRRTWCAPGSAPGPARSARPRPASCTAPWSGARRWPPPPAWCCRDAGCSPVRSSSEGDAGRRGVGDRRAMPAGRGVRGSAAAGRQRAAAGGRPSSSPVRGSIGEPAALTATSAATVIPPSSTTDAVPMPPLRFAGHRAGSGADVALGGDRAAAVGCGRRSQGPRPARAAPNSAVGPGPEVDRPGPGRTAPRRAPAAPPRRVRARPAGRSPRSASSFITPVQAARP